MKPLSEGELALYELRLLQRMQALAMNQFLILERHYDFTFERLAQRISMKPERVKRLLTGNTPYSLDDFSDILLGMGCEARVGISLIYPPRWWDRLWVWWTRIALPAIDSWNPCIRPLSEGIAK